MAAHGLSSNRRAGDGDATVLAGRAVFTEVGCSDRDQICRMNARSREMPTHGWLRLAATCNSGLACKLCKSSWAWLRTLTSPDLVRSVICGAKRLGELGLSVGSRGAKCFERLELDRLDLVLLLGVAGQIDHLVEVGGREHFAECGHGGRVAAAGERHGGVVADESVFVRLDPLAQELAWPTWPPKKPRA